MNRNSNNFTPLPGAWRTGVRAYDSHNSGYNEDDRISGVQNPARSMMENITPSGPNSTPNYPMQQRSRQQYNVLNGDIRRDYNPRFREIVQQSHPRTVENPRSEALSKLKKEIYDPTPKNLPKRVSLCYRDSVKNALKERERIQQEESKRCAICLEDFEPKEEVMLTPCQHLFHEDCIVPWITSKGQCPVCRFVICEKVRENNTSSFRDSNTSGIMAPSDLLIAGELLSILRAMQDAFQLGNGTH